MPPKEKTALRRRRPKWAGRAVAVEIISPEMLPNVSNGPSHLMDAPGDGLSVLTSGLQRCWVRQLLCSRQPLRAIIYQPRTWRRSRG